MRPKNRECSQAEHNVLDYQILCQYLEVQIRERAGSSLPEGDWEEMECIPRTPPTTGRYYTI